MKISDIIDGLEEVQFQKGSIAHSQQDVERVCELSKQLALHVQQLEVEFKQMKHYYDPD
jgi:hypothetical protein